MLMNFKKFLSESVKNVTAKKETTQHLPHVADLLFSKKPEQAIEHISKVHERFKGRKVRGHKTSLKIDGSFSGSVGRKPDGTYFVSYAKGKEKYESHSEIKKTGKKHFVQRLSPLLQHAKKMKDLKPGTAYQVDIVNTKKKHIGIAKPNTITYKIKPNAHMTIAAHSQYDVDHSGNLKKITSHPDLSQLKANGVDSPNLAMGRNIRLGINKIRSAKIDAHLAVAKRHLTPDAVKFAKSISNKHNSKFKQLIDEYSSHASRTSGRRSVDDLRRHVDVYMSKKEHLNKKESTRNKLHAHLHKIINDNQEHLGSLFKAHNHLNAAKNHILDEFKGHAHKFDIQTHGGEEHEGIVSTLREKHQAKLVREGPHGFPAKNEKTREHRFGMNKQSLSEQNKTIGKAFLLPGSYSPYTIGHHEMAKKAAAHAASTGHTHFYHGIGAAARQTADDPLSHAQKRSIIKSAHRDIAKNHSGMQFHTTEAEHKSPFSQLAHLARQGHEHITIGLGSDQMKGKLRSEIEKHVKKHGGILDKNGTVHKTTISFHQLGGERHEGNMPRHEVLARLHRGDMSVAKAGRLRNAVASNDTELAHALMPKHINKPKYFNLIQKQLNRSNKSSIKEDIELDPYIDPPSGKTPKFGKEYKQNKKFTYHPEEERHTSTRNLGEIHPGYELHRHTMTVNRARKFHKHSFSIVHKASGDVAGEIDAKGGSINRKTGEHRLGRGRGLKIDWVHVQPEHGTKKVGVSLAAAAYKHLHRRGHSIKSDTKQSIGGANLWNSLRHDPETKPHLMFHDERNNRPIPAHKVPEGEIWHDEPHAQETTLVLHAKPKSRKRTVKEDIELIPVHRDKNVDKRKAADVHKAYGSKTYSSDIVVNRKNLGQIHPGYDLHQHSVEINTGRGSERAIKHRFTIVHRASGDVAGEMHAWGGKLHPIKGVVRGTKGKGLRVSHLEVHPDHREKKIGASLPVEMYRHLHRRGYAIQSDAIQSHGAAHVWNTMRHDRELKKHMMIHDNGTPVRGQVHSFEKRAYRRPERHIWYQHGTNWSHGREKVEPSHGDEPETVKTLILSGKKRKKTVKEDIEMSQILNKPHGGYYRDFAKLVANKGITPKRSGRIAKGYSLHTSTDKDDPRIQNHHIVHDATGHVAGEVSTITHGKDHTVIHTEIHGDHTKKKIGKSLAVLAYKHLARKKGNLWSSGLQSPGGASVWNRIRKDPKMRGKVFHRSSEGGEVPAHDLPDKKIWASEFPVTKSRGTPEHLPAPKYSYHGATRKDRKEHSGVILSRLVIRHLKK